MFCLCRVGHYTAKFPYRENYEKGKETTKINRRRFENKRSFYTHEYSDGISNGEEGESDQEYQLLMAFEDRCSNESDDNFMDALEEKDMFIEEIYQLKIGLEEAKLAE